MTRRSLVLGAVALLAGCVLPGGPGAEGDPADPGPLRADAASSWPVTCLLLDESRAPLAGGACVFSFGPDADVAAVDAQGRASRDVPANATGTLAGRAEGRVEKAVSLRVDGPKTVEMVLEPVAPGVSPPAGGPARPTVPAGAAPPVLPARAWDAPVLVTKHQNEPLLAVDPQGALYVSPTSVLLRSHDGGRTWTDVTPPDALPTLASDTSLSVAPDGTLWWTRLWGYLGGTLACASRDQAATWTCNNLALPGVTDRMWVLGVSAEEAYLQTNEGAEQNVWTRTADGGATWTPFALAGTASTTRNGNMARDAATGAVWQVMSLPEGLALARVDGPPGLRAPAPVPVPASYALPSLAAAEGALWVAGEADGAGHVVMGRSLDGGRSWDALPFPTTAKAVSFTAVAAAPGGVVAVAYYGSDQPGAAAENAGAWSLRVARSDDALAPHPTWVESVVVPGVRQGAVCIGFGCDTSSGEGARFSGDLIGAAIDAQGNVHVAYVQDDPDATGLVMTVRQRLA